MMAEGCLDCTTLGLTVFADLKATTIVLCGYISKRTHLTISAETALGRFSFS